LASVLIAGDISTSAAGNYECIFRQIGGAVERLLTHAQRRKIYAPVAARRWSANEQKHNQCGEIMTFVEANDFPPHVPCSHDELKWGRKKEIIGGREITVCGRCREEITVERSNESPTDMDRSSFTKGLHEGANQMKGLNNVIK